MAGGLVGTGGAAQSTSTRLNKGGTGRRLVMVGGLGWQGVIGGWGRVLRVYIYNIRSRPNTKSRLSLVRHTLTLKLSKRV